MTKYFKNGKTGRLWVVALLLATLLTAACARQEESRSGDDAALTADADTPVRVVACSRSIGELWLLAGGELSGVTEDALELEGLSGDVSVIGSVTKPSLEAVLAMQPDLVLVSSELSAHRELAEALREAGIACEQLTVDSFDDYDAVMKALTEKTNRPDCYESHVTAVREKIGRVLDEAKRPDQRTYLAMRVSLTRNKVLKSDYFACRILNDFGLTNLADDNSLLDELNLEAIVTADPDLIFVIPQGDDEEATEAFREAFSDRPVWNALRAVQEKRVYRLEKELFQYKPNAKWDEAYARIAAILSQE